MTLDDLNLIHKEAAWLIAKRSGWSIAKALTVGSESLDKLVDKIGDLYDLSPIERRQIRPSIAADTHEGAGKAVNLGKTFVGATVAAESAAKAAQKAYKAGRLGKTLWTLVRAGPKAAQTVANTGRVAGKSNPIVMALTVGWAVGSTGWIVYHAQVFNASAYNLVLEREGLNLN